jgi:competence protein ComEC
LLAVSVALVWVSLRELPDGRLHVYFLDVGQGDAVFIRCPNGQQVLIDGGPSPSALLNEMGRLMPFWDRDLDLVVLTHPDADHLQGLLPVLERYQVSHVLDNGQAGSEGEDSPWPEHIDLSKTQHTRALRGMQLLLGDIKATVLHPDRGDDMAPGAGVNNASVVLRVQYGQTSFLLTGDAEQAAEAEMTGSGQPLGADVLKIAHHGSHLSTSRSFLEAVSPRLAVIQVGAENRFGHPHPDILALLAGVEVLRTDLHGRIEVVSDGRRLWVKTARPSASRPEPVAD